MPVVPGIDVLKAIHDPPSQKIIVGYKHIQLEPLLSIMVSSKSTSKVSPIAISKEGLALVSTAPGPEDVNSVHV